MSVDSGSLLQNLAHLKINSVINWKRVNVIKGICFRCCQHVLRCDSKNGQTLGLASRRQDNSVNPGQTLGLASRRRDNCQSWSDSGFGQPTTGQLSILVRLWVWPADDRTTLSNLVSRRQDNSVNPDQTLGLVSRRQDNSVNPGLTELSCRPLAKPKVCPAICCTITERLRPLFHGPLW